MEIYQHDSAAMFRFVLRGDLTRDQVESLEHAWTTAQSILNGKPLVVELSGITSADEFGVNLLSRMRKSGAGLTAALPPESEALLRALGVPVPAPRGRWTKSKVLRFLTCAISGKWRSPARLWADLGNRPL